VQQGATGPPPTPIYQPDVSTNEIRLPVGQFKDYASDLALDAYTFQHDVTQASFTDLLRLRSTTVKYRTPYLMERFIDASVNLETRAVDCCVNGCVAFTHTRSQETTCDARGALRYKANGKPAKQITYWYLTSWLAHHIGDPIIGKSMLENIAAARIAADIVADGVQDYYHGTNFYHYRDRGLLDHGPFVMLNCSTDGFHFFRKNGLEGWPIIATPLCLIPDQRNRRKYQLLLVVTPGPKQPFDWESSWHPIAKELDELGKGVPGPIIPHSSTPVVLRAGVLNYTTNQPGGDKITNFKGTSSYVLNGFREFRGVYVPASNPNYYPPKDPTSGSTLFKVNNCTDQRRTAATISACAADFEDARAEGR